MTESLAGEIRTLRSLFWSDRDPDGRAFAPLADACRRAGDVKQAFELLTDGLGRHPDFASGHVVAARLYFETGMSAEAELAAQRALELDPENVDALSTLAGALESRGASDEAADVRNRLGELDDASAARDEEPEAEEPVMSLEALAPDEEPEPDEPVMSLEALAPDEEPEAEEPVMSLDALAPDEEPEADEPVMSLEALAPDEEPEPDELVMSLEALAPDEEPEPDEPVMSLEALAPDEEPEPDEPVMSLEALAPDEEPEPDEPVMSLDALAPDEEPEPDEGPSDGVDADVERAVAYLAPDEPVMSLDDLAPAPDAGDDPSREDRADGTTHDEAVLSLDDLAPDEPVLSLDDLAPDADATPDDAEPRSVEDDVAALTPDEPVVSLDDLAPETDEGPEASIDDLEEAGEETDPDEMEDLLDEPGERDPLPTRTLADLYVRQGLTDQALSVYRVLLEADPDAEDLRERIALLEEGGTEAVPTPEPASIPHPDVEEPEAFRGEAASEEDESGSGDGADALDDAPPGDAGAGEAGDVADVRRETEISDSAWDPEGHDAHDGRDVETPFAWGVSDGDDEAPGGPPIGDYFARLLDWRSAGPSEGGDTGDDDGGDSGGDDAGEEPEADVFGAWDDPAPS